MKESHFITDYYISLLIFFIIIIIFTFLSSFDFRVNKIIDKVCILYAGYVTYLIGFRPTEIGIDTGNYSYLFNHYDSLGKVFENEDILFNFLCYLFNQFTSFNIFLTFCAFIYVFCSLFSFKVFFKKNYVLAFLVLLVSPYFIQFGINVMRNGMAASVFLYAVSVFFKNNNKLNVKFIIIIISSILLHISMVFPLVFLFISIRYYSKINILVIFIIILICMFLSVMNINILYSVVSKIPIINSRFTTYLNFNDVNFFLTLQNVITFGIPTLVFSFYFVIKSSKDSFYRIICCLFFLSYIPYVLALKLEFGMRVGFLADFMLPIVLCYPILSKEDGFYNSQFTNFKFTLLFFCFFIIKSYKYIL